jgi:dTDP-4-dehydrorhamnose reductase
VIYYNGKNSVADAENDPRTTQLLHASGTSHLVHASDLMKAKFIYISSDYVFSGIDGNHSETESTIPGTQLGKAKVSGETLVKTGSLNHLIIRCSPLLGRGTLDHASWLDQIREDVLRRKKVQMSTRELHNPVHISFLLDTLKKAIELDVRNRILHIGGLTKISLFDFTRIFLERFNLPLENLEASDASNSTSRIDYSLNFTDTLKLIEAKPLLLEQSLDLL